MIGTITDLDSASYGELLSKQFISIARDQIITNEKAWQLFLEQPDARKIAKHKLPVIKNILYGRAILEPDRLTREIKENKHCQLIPVLYTMSQGNLSKTLVKKSNIIVAKVLSY